MKGEEIRELFDREFLEELFPPERADTFFDALYGGAEEGAFDIELALEGIDHGAGEIHLEFRLIERPGKCMACSLTYGLPPVFERHPIIDIKGMVEKINERLPNGLKVTGWRLGPTVPKAPKVNAIPFVLSLA